MRFAPSRPNSPWVAGSSCQQPIERSVIPTVHYRPPEKEMPGDPCGRSGESAACTTPEESRREGRRCNSPAPTSRYRLPLPCCRATPDTLATSGRVFVFRRARRFLWFAPVVSMRAASAPIAKRQQQLRTSTTINALGGYSIRATTPTAMVFHSPPRARVAVGVVIDRVRC